MPSRQVGLRHPICQARRIGRSDCEKSAAASPVEDTASAPVCSSISFAFFVHSKTALACKPSFIRLPLKAAETFGQGRRRGRARVGMTGMWCAELCRSGDQKSRKERAIGSPITSCRAVPPATAKLQAERASARHYSIHSNRQSNRFSISRCMR